MALASRPHTSITALTRREVSPVVVTMTIPRDAPHGEVRHMASPPFPPPIRALTAPGPGGMTPHFTFSLSLCTVPQAPAALTQVIPVQVALRRSEGTEHLSTTRPVNGGVRGVTWRNLVCTHSRAHRRCTASLVPHAAATTRTSTTHALHITFTRCNITFPPDGTDEARIQAAVNNSRTTKVRQPAHHTSRDDQGSSALGSATRHQHSP